MSYRFALATLFVLVVAMLGCGGGGGGSTTSGTSNPPDIAPTLQSITPDPANSWIYFAAYAPGTAGKESPGLADYYVEGKWGTSDWVPLPPHFSIDGTDPSSVLPFSPFDAHIPEGVKLTVRVRVSSHGYASPKASNSLEMDVLPYAPLMNATFDPYHDWLLARCTNLSLLPTTFEYQASLLDGSGNPTTWVALGTEGEIPRFDGTADLLSAHYLPMENAPIAFRARVHTTTLASIWTTVNQGNGVGALVAGLAAPISLSATSDASGVHLTWTNRSTQGLNIALRRTFGQVPNPNSIGGIVGTVLATLPPGTTSYTDHPEAPGDYTYSIELTDGVQTVYGPPVQVTTFDGLATVYHPPIFGAGAHGFPEPNGNWFWFQNTTVEFDGSGKYLDTGLGQTVWMNPGPLYDAGGFPHLFAFGYGPNGPVQITHAWKDPGGWHHESPSGERFSTAIQDPDGTFWLCELTGSGPSSIPVSVRLLHGSVGSWSSSSLASPNGNLPDYPYANFEACGGPDGTLYFLYTTYNGGVNNRQFLLVRHPGGAVDEYQIPDLLEPSSPYTSVPVLGMVVDPSNRLHLFRALSSTYHQTFQAGVFSAPETLPQPVFAWTPWAISPQSGPAVSQSGGRLAWINPNAAQGLWMMDAAGWHYYSLPLVEFYGFMGEKFWYTSPVTDPTSGENGIRLFKEP